MSDLCLDLVPFEPIDVAVDVTGVTSLMPAGIEPLANLVDLEAAYTAALPGLRPTALAAGTSALGGGHHWLVPLAADGDDGDRAAALEAVASGAAAGVAFAPGSSAIPEALVADLAAQAGVLRLSLSDAEWWSRYSGDFQRQLAEHPAVRVLLLSVGGCLTPTALRSAWDTLPEEHEGTHLVIDGVTDWEVLRVLLRRWDRERLCWGSGFPLGAQLATRVTIGHQSHLVTATAQPWSLHYSDPERLQLGPLVHQALAAFHMAASKVGLKSVEAHAIFAGNALRLLDRDD